MKSSCPKCQKIIATEKGLDEHALSLTQKVKNINQDITDHNNKKWRNFAMLCSVPLLGNLIFKLFKTPFGLKSNREYWEEPWYRPQGKLIEQKAEKLETIKKNDLEHWGNEVVSPRDGTDPGGYYTPHHAPRKECYDRGLRPAIPEKYDFSSGAGVDKFHDNCFVMCSVSKKLYPKPECNCSCGISTNGKPVYIHRPLTKPLADIPGFNEWRSDNYYSKKYSDLRSDLGS